jgi:predicted DNA-binding transcriptional regulator AlpA
MLPLGPYGCCFRRRLARPGHRPPTCAGPEGSTPVNHDRLTGAPPEHAGTRSVAADGALSTRIGLTSADGPRASRSPRLAADSLISIADVRRIFGLGRTAAYELTRRPSFPDPVQVSARCYRWWASEVDAFAAALRRERAQHTTRRAAKPGLPDPATPPCRIIGNVRAARSGKKQAS